MSVFDGLPDALLDNIGEAVTVTPGGGTARTITAIYKAPQALSLTSDVGQREPMIRARTTDVSDLGDGDQVEARGRTFRVRYRDVGIRGLTTMHLEEVSG